MVVGLVSATFAGQRSRRPSSSLSSIRGALGGAGCSGRACAAGGEVGVLARASALAGAGCEAVTGCTVGALLDAPMAAAAFTAGFGADVASCAAPPQLARAP